jgi:hypothetical protein
MTPTPRTPAPDFNPGQGFSDEEDYDPGDWQAADELIGSAIPAFSFAELGATITGIVVGSTVSDQTDIKTGRVRTFDNGDVRRQLVLTVQTSMADDDDDDGQRRVFVKGAMVKQFRTAMARARVKGPRPGGELTVTYESDGKPAEKGLNPPKVYAITYTPPKR